MISIKLCRLLIFVAKAKIFNDCNLDGVDLRAIFF